MLLPGALLLMTAMLVAYVLRDALIPAVDVRVVPVVTVKATAPSVEPEFEPKTDPQPSMTDGGLEAAPRGVDPPSRTEERVIAQAPGWIEPSPHAIGVPALAEGIVREVLVLEGDQVDAGQIVARLVDDDARLALRRAEAELEERRSEVDRATAILAAAEARHNEVAVEIERVELLVASGAATADRLALLRARLQSTQRDVETERASVALARSVVMTAEVERDAAALRLVRMEIAAPVSGVVLARSIEPGMRVPSSASSSRVSDGLDAHGGAVMRLYNPAQLQARVDVPLADAARIVVGTAVLISTEALPDRVFRGRVVREAPEANIQRNTVEFKVSIEAPDRVLKPEMLVRARFVDGDGGRSGGGGGAGFGESDSRRAGTADVTASDEELTVAIDRRAVHDARGDDSVGRNSSTSGEHDRAVTESRHWVWLVDRISAAGPVARRRPVELGAALDAEHVIVRRGLRPGDRAIADVARPLRDGARVRVLGEGTAP